MFLSRNIVILSLISLFTDIASEMLYPITPLYLQQIGYGLLAIGILEGFAEFIAGIIKLYAGSISDGTHNRTIFIRLGYGISAVAKPLIGFATTIATIFTYRFMDRIGKGLRGAPRDALLADESTPENRGKVFGFHRSIDTLGAVLGPIITLSLLFVFTSYQPIFLLAFIPGIGAIILTFLVKEKHTTLPQQATKSTHKLRDFISFWKESSSTYRRLLIGFFLFAFINSSNVFLLLRAKELGLSNIHVIAAYVLYNLIYAITSYPAGAIADKFGFKRVYLFGILIFALTYGVLGSPALPVWMIFVIFAIYGIFSGIEDGASKAWITLHVSKECRATGLGLYLLSISCAFFAASIITGALWTYIGGSATFSLISLGSIGVGIYFALFPKQTLAV
jgi:MFS family permease